MVSIVLSASVCLLVFHSWKIVYCFKKIIFDIFVVATLMPTDLSTDPKCNKKKRHIGNDFVAIVYNNAGGNQGYTFGTVKGTLINFFFGIF